MTTQLSLAEQDVLLSVHELSPLWEIAFSLGERIHVRDQEELRERVIHILRKLADRGWLAIRRKHFVGSSEVGELSGVPIDQLGVILENPENWEHPGARSQHELDVYIFDTTSDAKGFITSGGVEDVWPRPAGQ